MQTATSHQELQATLLELLPEQGNWSESAYLRLTDLTSRLIEFTDGYVEVLPMPTPRHQALLRAFFLAFFAQIQPRGGYVHFAPLCISVRAGKFREPDLILVLDANDPRQRKRYWEGADLVLEVVSDDKRECDLIEKRFGHAEAGIAENWIADPFDETITVLRLAGVEYIEHGVSGRGARATSVVVPAFSVAVNAAFDAQK